MPTLNPDKDLFEPITFLPRTLVNALDEFLGRLYPFSPFRLGFCHDLVLLNTSMK